MPNSDDDEGSANDVDATGVDPAYLALFSEHLDHYRAHLIGRDRPESPPASHLPPNAFWSAAEKDAFFRALAVHSRLRPDLIAEEVKTKTLPDVCVYLAVLEEGAREAARKVIYVGGEKKTCDVMLARREFPIALEATDEWVRFEERKAEDLIAFEDSHKRELLAKERDEEVQSRRKAFRARRGEARTASNERDREGEKLRKKEFEAWLEGQKNQWEAEDVWRTLDQASLSALERILRAEEDGLAGFDTLPEDEVEHHADTEPTDHLSVPLSTPATGEELIDPLLLQLSRPSPAVPPEAALNANPAPSTCQPELVVPVHDAPSASGLPLYPDFRPCTPPFAPVSMPSESMPVLPLLPAVTILPQTVGEAGGSSVGDGAEEDVASMSPVSRRRYQKRLYMRRKRAQASGGVVLEDTSRLKPGRKPKQCPLKAGNPPREDLQTVATSSSVAIEDGVPATPQGLDSSPARPDTTQSRHLKVSGMTLPYKRQAQFESVGINAQRLHQEGVGLFHTQAIGKLMQTYNQLHDVPAEVGSQLSLDTLKVVHAILVEFVAELMSRAIVSREQERIAKLQTKAWHLQEHKKISAVHVRRAITLHGADHLNKRAHFARLFKELGLDEPNGTGADQEDNEDVEGGDMPGASPSKVSSYIDPEGADERGVLPDSAQEDDPPFKPLSPLRMIYPPIIDLPSYGPRNDDDAAALDPSTYMPWPSSSLLSNSSEPLREEDLLPETVDEVALVAELRDDENIEKEDHLRDLEEEKRLWARFGGKPGGPADHGATQGDVKQEPVPCTKTVPLKRKRKVRPKKRAKEAEQSDEAAGDAGSGAGEGGTDRTEQEEATGRRVRRRKGKGTAHMNEDQLRFMEPDPSGRIKSSVYVLDSD
ncbi:hypothetical protein BD413DRAFT_495121 [Trametes elegans]|nr:hypothetical protein BD413DRAFT_495121 [Trametes elegans]